FKDCTALKDVYMANPDPASSSCSYATTAFPSNSNMRLLVTKASRYARVNYRNMEAFSQFATVATSSLAYDMYFTDGAYLCVTKDPTRTTVGELALVGFNANTSGVKDGKLEPSCGSGNYNFEGYSYKLTSVASDACLDNTGLKYLDFGSLNYLTTIGADAFSGCTALTGVRASIYSLTTIGERAYYGCTSLKQIQVPINVDSCAHSFIDGCSNIYEIVVDPDNKTFASEYGLLVRKDNNKLVRCPEGWEHHDINNLTREEQNVFTNPIIGTNALMNCKNLTKVVLAYGVTQLEAGAFYKVPNVTEVRIPSSVKKWGNTVFKDCPKLATLYVNIQSPPSVSSDEFSGCKRTTLHTYAGAFMAYQYDTAPWRSWSNYKNGAYDELVAEQNPETGTRFETGYTYLDTRPDTINGKDYQGHVMLSYVGKNVPSNWTVPSYILYDPDTRLAVSKIGGLLFYDDGLEKDLHLTLPATVDTINRNAFLDVAKLKSIVLSPRLKLIDANAFSGTGLRGEIVLPYGLKKLGMQCFGGAEIASLRIPSSCKLESDVFKGMTFLTQLVLNNNELSTKTVGTSSIPKGCAVFVPAESWKNYQKNSSWSHCNVIAGASDFTYNDEPIHTAAYHITVISDEPVVKDGVTYAGKAKYVFHPANNKGSNAFTVRKEETNVTLGANQTYLMTELGDSLLAGCTDKEYVAIHTDAAIERIGSRILQNSGVIEFTVPSTVTEIARDAFRYASSLKELLILRQDEAYKRELGANYFGNNAADFKCYVPWQDYETYRMQLYKWVGGFSSDNLQSMGSSMEFITDTQAAAVHIAHPFKWAGLNKLDAYIVDGYDKATNTVHTTKVSEQDVTSMLLKGIQKNLVYKLARTTNVERHSENMLGFVPASSWEINAEASSEGCYAYTFDDATKTFVKAPRPTYMPDGYAFLKIKRDSIDESTQSVKIDLWSKGVKGDVNGDGVVNVSDVTALINKILGTATYADDVCDINGDGKVNVSDVTALINQILG
ncbi:MAG: leucine-rich repeat protein, partial [Bacteroidales bacterium]|nr:leucine-rich repeat protein [Bacteroidales bacterium]